MPTAPVTAASKPKPATSPPTNRPHTSSDASTDSAVLISASESSTSSSETNQKEKLSESLEDAERLKAENKAFYEELTKEDKQEEEAFLKLIMQDAHDVKLARQMMRDARRVANSKAVPLHRSACPESADVEPPLSFHHQAWQQEQQAHMQAEAKLQPPPLPQTFYEVDQNMVESSAEDKRDVSLSSLSSADGQSSDSEVEHDNASSTSFSSVSLVQEVTFEQQTPTLSSEHPHVHFEDHVQGIPPSVTQHATFLPPSSERQYYRSNMEPRLLPNEKYSGNSPHNRRSVPIAKTTTDFVFPGPLTRALQAKPWAYQSLWRISMLSKTKRLHRDLLEEDGFLHQDAEISFEDFESASQRYIDELKKIHAPTAKLLQKHFIKISSLHSPEIWPTLRIYDIRVRSAHLGDTSTDLLHLDKRLLGTIMIEEADESLHHFHLGSGGPDMTLRPTSREQEDLEEVYDPRFGIPSREDEVDELEEFLDDVYKGAGRFAQHFHDAGVTSPESFAEAALLDAGAIDELVDAVQDKSKDMSAYLGIMLKKGLKRRFAASPAAGSPATRRRRRDRY